MTQITERHVPCPCGRSSDAYCLYDDGHGFCFSCSKPFQSDQSVLDSAFTYEYLPWRGITKETMQLYGAITKIDNYGQPIAIGFPYAKETLKIRRLDKKEFYSSGNMATASLFGHTCFQAGQSRLVTITEGELDAMSVYQMLGSKFPVVSVRSLSYTAGDDLWTPTRRMYPLHCPRRSRKNRNPPSY